MSYLNISSRQVLNIFKGVSLPDGIEVEESKVLAYRGFKLKRSFTNPGFVYMEKAKMPDASKSAQESRNPLPKVSETIDNMIISYEDTYEDCFFILESDHKLIMKNLAEGEILKVKKSAVVMKNIQGREVQTMMVIDLINFVEFKGPGILFLDPIKGSSFNSKQMDFAVARKMIIFLGAAIAFLVILNTVAFVIAPL